MKEKIKQPFVSFVLLSTGIFLLFFFMIGLLMSLGAPSIVYVSIQIISAWSSTFALIILFKRIYPDLKFINFVKKQFSTKLNLLIVSLAVFVPTIIFFMIAYLLPSEGTFAISKMGWFSLIGFFC